VGRVGGGTTTEVSSSDYGLHGSFIIIIGDECGKLVFLLERVGARSVKGRPACRIGNVVIVITTVPKTNFLPGGWCVYPAVSQGLLRKNKSD